MAADGRAVIVTMPAPATPRCPGEVRIVHVPVVAETPQAVGGIEPDERGSCGGGAASGTAPIDYSAEYTMPLTESLGNRVVLGRVRNGPTVVLGIAA